ncbi:MAG: DUF362 domain-containing protein [Deltaproteobacteria bacterium]|nr:DUF362 domain-containing protein [Deltaproteobacteria bacterium]
MSSEMVTDLMLPKMRMIRQRFDIAPAVNASTELDREWPRVKAALDLPSGSKIAIGVGSRGISNLFAVVRDIVDRLKEAGYDPFVTPAMGSHGGATAEGQTGVLRHRGITEESVGAPVKATMDVKPMGEVDGIPLFLDRLASEADGIVLINRVKPHTNFIGPTESGIIKMMAIGLGNQAGAEHYHRLSVVRSQYEIISSAGKALLEKCPLLFGVCLLENQAHETARIKIALRDEVERVESELLKTARAWLPTLPLDEMDLLIIDEMGKDISGEGIDPCVVGRDVCVYGAKRPWPKITRIFVRDLTAGSEGSALGISQADFTTRRLVDKIDFDVSLVNAITACCPESMKVPLTFESDREAIATALKTLRPYTQEDIRIVHIKNTLELTRLMVSVGSLDSLNKEIDLVVGSEDTDLAFDGSGNIISDLYDQK